MESNKMRKILLIVSLVLAIFVALVSIISTFGEKWTCDSCGKEWKGKAYCGSEYTDTLCEDCAAVFWYPLPIEKFEKDKNNAIDEDEELTETPYETTTEALIREFSFTAISDFHEGLACVQFANNYCYINKLGEVQFLLPDGYDSGEPFYDGFAVIKKGKSICSVIDTNGKIIIDGEKDNLKFISRASEKIICARKVEESYTGTQATTLFFDYNGNIVSKIENMPWEDYYLGYFQFGTVGIAEDINGWDKTFYYYDKNGKLVKTVEGLAALQSDGQYVYSQYPSSVQKGEVFDRKNLKMISKIERLVDDVAPKNAEYFAYCRYDKEAKKYLLVISDRNGKTKTYNIDGLDGLVKQKERDDNRWVIKLQNGYYAIIDETAKFILEPVKSEIRYIGESMYFLVDSKMVVDKDGKELFVSLHDLRNHTSIYHDGMLRYGNGYICNNGQMLDVLKIKEEF